jgi:cell wall-associated NlpC family hydrolase
MPLGLSKSIRKQINKPVTIKLKPGDIIWANRMAKGLPYNHCGVYAGNGKVIHFAAPAGSEISIENAVVHETTLKHFQDNCPLKIISFPKNVRCFSSEKTVERARSRIGEKGYDFLTNNCDHFAIWCKTGKHCSLQAEVIKKTIRATENEVGEIICGVHDIIQLFMSPENKINKRR